jgi:glycosyltransferase involved in cell wall biosynthesis
MEIKMKPKISVLIPAYNVENYIQECLDSVLTQSLHDIEVICVDDASVDDTLSLLNSYEVKDERVRVLRHDTNKGQAAGRNLAYSYARGEYVYMLDADDKIVPGALEELYRLCKEDNLDVAGFETHQFMDDISLADKLPAKMISYDDTDVMDGAAALEYCMKRDVFSLSVPTFMIKREYLEENKIRFAEMILHEDVGYIFELVCRADRIKFLHKVYFLRRVRAHSTMTSAFSDRNIEGYLKSFSRSFELEQILADKYAGDEKFMPAVRKWRRDIYGRIRQLYLENERDIYSMPGGNAGEEIRHMFNLVKLDTCGPAQAEEILGSSFKDLQEALSDTNEVYVCGTGQYSERIIGVLGALDIIVKGVMVLKKERNSFRGFPVRCIEDSTEDGTGDTPVVLSVSRYYADEYVDELKRCGYKKIVMTYF